MQRANISTLLFTIMLVLPMAAIGQTKTAEALSTSFEVSSVRAVSESDKVAFPSFPTPRFDAENLPLTVYIAIAYGISDTRIMNKPSWLDDARFSVHAKPEGDAPLTEKQYQPLLQDFLSHRFHLAAHFETREVSGYELVIAKGGAKLDPAQPSDAMSYIFETGLDSASVTLSGLASLLSRPVGRPVIDSTGLAGSYKLKLRFAREGTQGSELPDIFTAVQEQLGLKLEPKKVPAKFLVIEHVDKTPTEN
jgi:uncharacterized protein (TIGR03435 family)